MTSIAATELEDVSFIVYKESKHFFLLESKKYKGISLFESSAVISEDILRLRNLFFGEDKTAEGVFLLRLLEVLSSDSLF